MPLTISAVWFVIDRNSINMLRLHVQACSARVDSRPLVGSLYKPCTTIVSFFQESFMSKASIIAIWLSMYTDSTKHKDPHRVSKDVNDYCLDKRFCRLHSVRQDRGYHWREAQVLRRLSLRSLLLPRLSEARLANTSDDLVWQNCSGSPALHD